MDNWTWSPRAALGAIDANRPPAVQGTSGQTPQEQAKPKTAPLMAGSENALVGPPRPSTNNKRKANVLEEPLHVIHEDDPRLHNVTDSCQVVRRKILSFIESGIMKVSEFQRALDVSPGAYRRFMSQIGTAKGEGCDTYWKAFAFLKRRELQGLPINKAQVQARQPAAAATGSGGKGSNKKAKTAAQSKQAAEALLDVSGVHLDGEETSAVPVYDSCGEVRKKIRAMLRRDGVSQAALCRAMAKMCPGRSAIAATSMAAFLNHTGAWGGNTSVVFYAGYVFFEKLRVKEGKPKSQFRLKMEEEHGREGVDTQHSLNGPMWCFGDEVPSIDEFGKVHFHKGGRRY